jgi:hypothetical protein
VGLDKLERSIPPFVSSGVGTQLLLPWDIIAAANSQGEGLETYTTDLQFLRPSVSNRVRLPASQTYRFELACYWLLWFSILQTAYLKTSKSS